MRKSGVHVASMLSLYDFVSRFTYFCRLIKKHQLKKTKIFCDDPLIVKKRPRVRNNRNAARNCKLYDAINIASFCSCDKRSLFQRP